MAEALPCDFDEWLKDLLISLETDDEVFSPYIKSILDGDDTEEEKMEALQGIISEITDSGIDDVCQKILSTWQSIGNQVAPVKEMAQVTLDDTLTKLLEEQKTRTIATNKTVSKEQQSLKQAILAQYSQVSDGEEDSEEEEAGGMSSNVEAVIKAEKDMREKNKMDAQQKKDKDKEDRIKQKAKDEERKDKEKKRTQKGERRR